MEMPNDNSIEVAVMQEKIKILEDNVCELQSDVKCNKDMTTEILSNHLPHIALDVQNIKGAVNLLGEKVSPAIKLVYGAVGVVLLTVGGAILAVILK